MSRHARHRALDAHPLRDVVTSSAAVRTAAVTTGSLAAIVAVATPASAGVPPGVSTTASDGSAMTSVTVVRGDTVSAIAARAGLSTDAVLVANGLSASSVIYPGQQILLPAGAGAAATAGGPPAQGASARAMAAVAAARTQIGVAYHYGGESPQEGFDCSGLIQWAYAQAGVPLPRTVAALRATGSRVGVPRPGDLVLFDGYHHAAVYVGDGMIIDSPHTGAFVSVRKLWTDRVVYRRVA